MWASVRSSDRRFAALALALALWAGATAACADAPARVVSMNLCTDQLAMLLAAPGQLISVSNLASDPLSSPMVKEAAAFPANRGGAEQIFLMQPDLVLAGSYTSVASVALLRDLGVRVEQLPPASSLQDVAAQMREVGALLGQAEKAEAMAAAFEASLEKFRHAGDPATAAMYYPNGYTTGEGTLSDDILKLAGFRNIGAEAGVTGGGILPLERLVMAAPDLIVTSTPYPGASRSEEILAHPALTALRGRAGAARITDADWICGTPYLLRAIEAMAQARAALGTGP
jgi:iron complex transport system substrate-binding protein